MEKEFNVTGTCVPELHYMVDISDKLEGILRLVAKGKYFVINKPRQYGKTTTLYMLERYLSKKEDYLVASISLEGIGDKVFENEEDFAKEFIELIADSLSSDQENLAAFLKKQQCSILNFKDLSKTITAFVTRANKNVILMIDEVDKSSNNQLFLSFLGVLRSKYLLRNVGKDKTFYSVILAGVHDVKSLKLKIRSNEEHKYNSPWNIASSFNVNMSFSQKEIHSMLEEYTKSKNVELDIDYFSDRLLFYTSGYPFLVSQLCKIIDEEIMVEKNLKWERQHMDEAVKKILRENNTNFESLIKNIENNSKLKEIVKSLIMDGADIAYNEDNPVIMQGVVYGIFANRNGRLKIHNRVYEQRIYNYLSSLIETFTDVKLYNEKSKFIKQNGDLDVKTVLLKFQEFMRHEYSKKSETFLERDGRLLFLAFMNPIINGTGFAFKEVQGGDEKRFDVVITYNKKMYILELKIWRGEEYNRRGLVQLGEYLEQYLLDEGYLLIFDLRKSETKAGRLEEMDICINEKNKKILEVYC